MPVPDPVPPVTAYDALAPVYDTLYQDAVSLAENAVIFRWVRRHYTPGLTVLDLGCGTGLALDYLTLPTSAYLGLDCSPTMLEQARKAKPAHTFHLGYMEALPPTCRDIDLALALFGSFPYCQDQAQAVRETYRVLTPGGRLLCMAYSPRYPTRPCHVRERQLGLGFEPTCLPTRSLARTFAHVPWRALTITGFNAWADDCPPWVPSSIVQAYLTAESHTLGRWDPDRCYWLLVEAVK